MEEIDRIPDKGKEYVEIWAERIKPLLNECGKLRFCENKADHFDQSYTWYATPTEEAKDLVEVSRIRTLHTFGYYGFFKPSVAEVIQQIPEELLAEVDFFLLNGPETADDLNKEKELLNEGYHVAECVLYRKCSNSS